jgi:hypothetical protein
MQRGRQRHIGVAGLCPKRIIVGRVSDADFALRRNVSWYAAGYRGRRPVLQRICGQARRSGSASKVRC